MTSLIGIYSFFHYSSYFLSAINRTENHLSIQALLPSNTSATEDFHSIMVGCYCMYVQHQLNQVLHLSSNVNVSFHQPSITTTFSLDIQDSSWSLLTCQHILLCHFHSLPMHLSRISAVSVSCFIRTQWFQLQMLFGLHFSLVGLQQTNAYSFPIPASAINAAPQNINDSCQTLNYTFPFSHWASHFPLSRQVPLASNIILDAYK